MLTIVGTTRNKQEECNACAVSVLKIKICVCLRCRDATVLLICSLL
jgi:hypothetical protein